MKEITFPSGSLLQFHEEPHEYHLWTEMATEPELIDGIHAVMVQNKVTKPPDEWVRAWIERGKRVHAATERYDLGLPIDPAWIASDEHPYLEDWRKFKKEHPEFDAPPEGVECLKGDEEAGMATVVDRLPGGNRILQVKTGEPNPKVHAVQMAFEGLLALPSAAHFECFAVYLKGDGNPILKQYEVFEDGTADLAMKIMSARRAVRKYMTTRRKPTKAVKV